jgi:lysozyme family protein
MPPTPEQRRAGYHQLWDRAKVRPDSAAAAKAVAQKILANLPKYEGVTAKTGVPVQFIGPVHNRESSLRFNAHLHCGDPLTARTYHVPKGRPAKGNPPFSWEESAIDALTMPPHCLHQVHDWSVERTLFEEEKYNGWGYLKKGNSPYLWAGTSEYHGGKYVADGKYSASAWDKQLGCVAVMKALAELSPEIAARLNNRQPTPPAGVVDGAVAEATKNDKRAAAGGAAATAGSATTKATTEKPAEAGAPQFAHSYLLPLAIAIGVVIVVVCVVRVARKAAYIKSVW